MIPDLKPALEKTLLYANDGAYVSYRIPGIVVTGRHTLLVCCEGRSDPRSDWGAIDILIARSEDGGVTWSPFSVLRGQQDGEISHTYSNPTWIVDDDRVHLIYHCDYRQAYIIHSMDDGRTWSEAEEITGAFRQFPYTWNVCATGPGHGIRLRTGRLLAPVWLANGQEENGIRKHFPSVAGCVYSDDRGHTWHAGPLANQLYDGNETTAAETDTGAVLFNFRTRSDCRKRFTGLLESGASSYSNVRAVEALDDPMCFGSMIRMEKGDIAFVNCRNALERKDLALHITSDHGASWRCVGRLDPMGGYADVAASGEWLFVLFERQCLETKSVKEIAIKAFRRT